MIDWIINIFSSWQHIVDYASLLAIGFGIVVMVVAAALGKFRV